MNGWLHDLWRGGRGLLRAPVFSLLVVLSLSIGVGAATAVFSVLKGVVLDALPYREPERLLSLGQRNSDTDRDPSTMGYQTFLDVRERNRVFAGIAAYGDVQASVASGETAEFLYGYRVSRGFFGLLGVKPMLGRDFLAEEDTPDRRQVVMLSYSLWQGQFGGDRAIVGKTIMLSGNPRTVVGVLPADFRVDLFSDSARQPALWLPLGYAADAPYACRSCSHLRTIGRLRDGIALDAAGADLMRLSRELQAEHPDDYPATMQVLAKAAKERMVGQVGRVLWLLFGAVGVLVLIVCVNVGNLLLVRAQRRQTELALRAALGADARRLTRLLFAESLVLATLGGLLGIAFAAAATHALVNAGWSGLPRLTQVGIDKTVLGFALLLVLLSALFAGSWPAWRGAHTDPAPGLKDGGRAGQSRVARRAQAALITAQVALAFVLMLGASLVTRSFVSILDRDPGFVAQNVLTVNLAPAGPRYDDAAATVRFFAGVQTRVAGIPGVQSAGVVSPLPLSGGFDRAGFHRQDVPLESTQAPEVDRYYASADYFRTLGVPVLRGRGFDAEDRAGSAPVAVINRTLAQQLWGDRDPVGARVQLGGRDDNAPWATIVGVVGDVRQYGLDTAMTAQAYLLEEQQAASFMTLVVRSTLAQDVLSTAVRQAVREIDPSVPVFDVATMEQRVSDSLARRRFALLLLGLFAATAMLLCALGIYGVVAQVVAGNTQAIGVQRALGARSARIARWTVQCALRPVGAGLALGAVASLGWGAALRSELVGIDAMDPLSFATVTLGICLVVAIACIAPLWRAVRLQPIHALRHD